MAEAAEIPEANDPFEKRVAITIAILAIVLSVIGNIGDNADTGAIINTNLATDKWGYYQAKSIKENIVKSELGVLSALASADQKAALEQGMLKDLASEQERYAGEKDGIKKEAEDLEKEIGRLSNQGDRCDMADLFVQIAIVIASVAILSHVRMLWYCGMALGLVGSVIGLSAMFM